MDDKTDDKVERLRPAPYVRTAQAARTDTEPLWPGFTDPYKAAATPDSGDIPRLVVVMGREGFKAGATARYFLQYAHIGLGRCGFTASGEQWFSFVFADRQPQRLTAQGRNIERIGDYISRHRMPWIRLADRDFRSGDGAADDEPIFTKIVVEDWLPLQE